MGHAMLHRYSDCPDLRPGDEVEPEEGGDRQITCPSCREWLGLPRIEERGTPVLVVELDRTSAMILDALRADLANEPPEANGNMPLPLQDEAAKTHAHWQDKVSAWRLLLGVRLVNAALASDPTHQTGDHHDNAE